MTAYVLFVECWGRSRAYKDFDTLEEAKEFACKDSEQMLEFIEELDGWVAVNYHEGMYASTYIIRQFEV